MTSSPPSLHHDQINATAVADGNSMTTATSTPIPWNSESNWTVSRGSLDSAVTFESFDFPIDSESTGSKSPLLLVPSSSSDFEPCEIKLNFTQKHEIRQVYVRSTARVYEIYYTPDLKSESEYLCTVRCSSVEEDLFPETSVKEAISVNSEGQNEKLSKGKVAGENTVGTNEDDWVEIKLPVSNTTSNTTKNYHQNYYEATAEINDSDPCISLTLRLLSLQTKTCVYIDEVYVFADPIDLEDSKNPTVIPEASGSSLMTMLVPTLFGLTKSKSLQLPDHQPISKPVQEPVKIKSTQSPVETHKQDQSLLEQLVSRVSRIEDMLLRFEENILKPVNRIESRLEHVEHQVELLAKKFPVLPSDPKNPENSESESEKQDLKAIFPDLSTRSEPNPENSNELCGESESEKKDFKSIFLDLPSSQRSETKNPENSNELCGESESEKHPESPCSDEKDVLEPQKTKKPVSIDDALAAALAGFSSFTKPNDEIPVLPLESPEEHSLECNQESSDRTSELNNNNETSSISCESPKATTSEFIEEEENYKTDPEVVTQDSNGEVKTLTLDKFDILKCFPDQSSPERSESVVDFESLILEVKFASLENGSLKSHLQDFLLYKDEGVSTDETETTTTENGLLDLDGDYVTEGVQQDLLPETSFESLI